MGKQKLEKQKKSAKLCRLPAECFGTWDVGPPETPKACYGGSMFYAQREPFRTNLDRAPDEPTKLPFPSFANGKRPGSARPDKVATSYQKLALTPGKTTGSLLGSC